MFSEKDFFSILNYLQNEERATSDLPYEIQQLAQSIKKKTQQYFQSAIDIPAFNSDDYNRLRRMIIDWYSSLKTFQDLSKGSSDAFSLPEDLLDLSCRGFGFDYSAGIRKRIDKALFLYDLCNLYKLKGTPQSIKSALEYFGLKDITMFEWWLKYSKEKNDLFLESKYIDLGDINPLYVPNYSTSYLNTNFDPHWWYTKDQIIQKLDSNKHITLPSITPYFSLSAGIEITTLTALISLVGRIIADQYLEFISDKDKDGNIKNMNEIPSYNLTIFIELYGSNNVSLLELMLAINYLMYLLSGSRQNIINPDLSAIQYNESDSDSDGIFDEDDSEIVIDEFGQCLTYPRNTPQEYNEATRQTLQDKLSDFNSSFSRKSGDSFILDSTALVNVFTLVSSGNPKGGNLKNWIDENWTFNNNKIVTCLSNFLHELDVYCITNYHVITSSFEQMVLGGVNVSMMNIIKFFKPKKARLLNLALVYVLSDPLINTLWLDEDVRYKINYIPNATCGLVVTSDGLKQIISHRFRNILFWDSNELDGRLNYDFENYYDRFPFKIYDQLLLSIRHFKPEKGSDYLINPQTLLPIDSTSGLVIDFITINDRRVVNEKITSLPGYDMGYMYDNLPGMCWDYIQKIIFHQVNSDYLKPSYNYDYLHVYDEQDSTEFLDCRNVYDVLIPSINNCKSEKGSDYLINPQTLLPIDSTSGLLTDSITINHHVVIDEKTWPMPGYDIEYIYDDPPVNRVFDANEIHVYQLIDSTSFELDPSIWFDLTFTISGTVSGASEVEITLIRGEFSTSIIVDSDGGTYEFTNVPAGDYAMIPTKDGYTFDPIILGANVYCDVSNLNFTAIENTYTISGIITPIQNTYSISGTVSGDVSEGVLVTLSGDTSDSTTTGVDGTYEFTNLSNGNYVITPDIPWATIIPESIEVNDLHSNITNANFVMNVLCIEGTISGVISENIPVILSGGVSDSTAITDVNGYYSFWNVSNGDYIITPAMDTYTFEPANIEITIFDDISIDNNFVSADIIRTFTVTFTEDGCEPTVRNSEWRAGYWDNLEGSSIRIGVGNRNGSGHAQSPLTFNCYNLPSEAVVSWEIGTDGNNGTGEGIEWVCYLPDPPNGEEINRCPMKMTVTVGTEIFATLLINLAWPGW